MSKIISPSTLCLSAAMLAAFLIIASGCAPPPRAQPEETIAVEGRVMARGQEPFSAYVLETESGSMYVLKFPEGASAGISTPSRIRVTGRLYAAAWDGRPFAHIDVGEWERAP